MLYGGTTGGDFNNEYILTVDAGSVATSFDGDIQIASEVILNGAVLIGAVYFQADVVYPGGGSGAGGALIFNAGPYGVSEVWGSVFVEVTNGAIAVYTNTASSTFLITYGLYLDGLQNAQACDASLDTCAIVALTPANLDTAYGSGGFISSAGSGGGCATGLQDFSRIMQSS